jgi:calcineurin-like phosphoesterase
LGGIVSEEMAAKGRGVTEKEYRAMRRVEKKLCGIPTCTCGDRWGER